MSSLKELIAQRAELEAKIAEIQREERSGAILKVKALMSEHGLTAADISGRASVGQPEGERPAKAKVAVKFRNVATGEAWTGRGQRPRWLKAALEAGSKLEDFAV